MTPEGVVAVDRASVERMERVIRDAFAAIGVPGAALAIVYAIPNSVEGDEIKLSLHAGFYAKETSETTRETEACLHAILEYGPEHMREQMNASMVASRESVDTTH